jgi:hypothetical protein
MSRQSIQYFASIGAFLTAILASCGTTEPIPDPYSVAPERQHENIYYVPSAAYSPLSAKKNDFDLSVLHSSGNRFSGLDMQAGYIASKHIGLTAGVTAVRHPSGSPRYMDYDRVEGGAGYLAPLKNGWHLETYGGIGTGKVRNNHHTGYSKVKQVNFYLQPAIAYNIPQNTFTFGVVSRVSAVHFSPDNIYFDPGREEYSAKNFAIMNDQSTHLMWEPGLVMRAGWKNFKFDAGYRFSTDLTNSSLYRSNGSLSLGASLQFGAINKN